VDIETDAVAGAVGHVACGVWSALGGESHGISVGLDDLDRLGVYCVGGDTCPRCPFCGGLCFKNGRVHFGDFVGDIAVDDAAGAVAVVVGCVDEWEEVDDDRLTSKQRTMSPVVAIGADRSTSNDRAVWGGAAVFEEPDIDHFEHAFGCERGAVEQELAARVSVRIGDGFACHPHASFSDRLGVAEVVEFFLVFGAAVEHA